MKGINAVDWTSSGVMAAQILVTLGCDDLATQRSYVWTLVTAEGAPVDSGKVVEDGSTYTPLLASVQYAYDYVAAQLSNLKNVTITLTGN